MSFPIDDWPVLALVLAALAYDFLNGFHDSGNIVATMVVSGAMEPGPALWLAALGEFAGPFLFGVAVAKTIGAEVVDPTALTTTVVTAALLGATAWNLATWLLRLPSSSSHALLGGLIGAVGATAGLGALRLAGLGKMLLALLLAPLGGLALGFLFLNLVLFLARGQRRGSTGSSAWPRCRLRWPWLSAMAPTTGKRPWA
jgi:PiT family inorganic phosphate transporter